MIKRLDRDRTIAGALAGERLGVPSVLFFVMSAAAPLTVVAGTEPTAFAVTGNLGLPATFAGVGVLLGVFCVGYVAMSRHLPHAGAFYAYVAHGLGRALGVAAAWVSLLAYDAIQSRLEFLAHLPDPTQGPDSKVAGGVCPEWDLAWVVGSWLARP